MSCLKVERHSQSRPSSPLQLHLLSTFTSRNKFLRLSTMSSYSIPIDTSFYDIPPNDFFHIPYMNQFGSQAEAGTEGSYYYPLTGGELAPSYPTYNGLPLFQTQPSLPSTTPGAESPASWESPWSHSSGSVSNDLSQPPLQPNAVNAHLAVAQHGPRRRGGSSRLGLATYSRRTTSSRRTIGKNKKDSSTAYAAKLVRSFQTRLGI